MENIKIALSFLFSYTRHLPCHRPARHTFSHRCVSRMEFTLWSCKQQLSGSWQESRAAGTSTGDVRGRHGLFWHCCWDQPCEIVVSCCPHLTGSPSACANIWHKQLAAFGYIFTMFY